MTIIRHNFYRSYEVDETFPNTVVVTIDATHHMRMPPGLMRQVHNHMQANNLFPPSQNAPELCKTPYKEYFIYFSSHYTFFPYKMQ